MSPTLVGHLARARTRALRPCLLGAVALSSLAGCSRHHTADEGPVDFGEGPILQDGSAGGANTDGGVTSLADGGARICVGLTGVEAITCMLGASAGQSGALPGAAGGADLTDLIGRLFGRDGGTRAPAPGGAPGGVDCRNPTGPLAQLVCGMGMPAQPTRGRDAGPARPTNPSPFPELTDEVCANTSDLITALLCAFVGGGGPTQPTQPPVVPTRRDAGTVVRDAGTQPLPPVDAGQPATELDAYVPPAVDAYVPPAVEADAGSDAGVETETDAGADAEVDPAEPSAEDAGPAELVPAV